MFRSLHTSMSSGLALCPVLVCAAILLRFYGCSFPVTSRRHQQTPVLLQPLKPTSLLQCSLNCTQNKTEQSNSNLNLSHEKPKVELLVTVIQVSPKTIQAIVALGCLSEVKGQSLLLKAPHTSDTTWTTLVVSNLKASFLESSFYSNRRCYVNCCGMEVCQCYSVIMAVNPTMNSMKKYP